MALLFGFFALGLLAASLKLIFLLAMIALVVTVVRAVLGGGQHLVTEAGCRRPQC